MGMVVLMARQTPPWSPSLSDFGGPASVGGDLFDAHACRQGEMRYTRYTVTVVDYQRLTKSALVTPRYILLHPTYPPSS
jgi:hypothetical protein